MSESSPWQTIIIPILTTALTLAGTNWQTAHQEMRADKERFIDGAQATAQETSHLLDDGYQELSKLLAVSGDKGWKEYATSDLKDYLDFHRKWRRQLIEQHFKLVRYFGKDIADQLTHVDEIDIHPVNNLASSRLCTPPGDKNAFDLEKLAEQAECNMRGIAIEQDVINDAKMDQGIGKVISGIQVSMQEKEFASKLVSQYDTATVSYLRQLDARLTQLGQPQVTLIDHK